MMVAGSQAAGTGTDLAKRQGIDGTTAGTFAAAGLSATPAQKCPSSATRSHLAWRSGAVGNVVTNAGGAAIQSKLLEGMGYDAQAKQFDRSILRGVQSISWLEWSSAALPTGRPEKEKSITPSDADAVLTASNAKHFQQDTAPGVPADATASAASVSA